MSESRTKKSIQNVSVALVFCAIELVLKFISRKVFLDYLGTEVLGLNTTAMSLLSFLNIAELGIGAAVAVTLYKPLFDDDKERICEIISLQGWFYRKVAYFVLAGSAVLYCFFPIIFKDMELPLWYAYASFTVFLFSSLLSYFVAYKQVLLSADQKDYKVQYSYRLPSFIKLLVQIIVIPLVSNGFIWWLALEVLFAFLATGCLNIVIAKTYPYLKTVKTPGLQLAKRYPVVITKIKQIFVHKITTFISTNLSPLIIYAYASLSLVAIYGNYMMIVSGLVLVLNAMFNSMGAGVGNLIAEDNKQRIVAVFRELFSSRYLIVTTFTLGLYVFTDPFISLWVGPEYLLDKFSLVLIVLYFYLNTTRSVVETYIYAYGLFKDIWAPIVEGVLNLGLSLLLGYFWGLHGILIGINISLLVIVFCWKPYFLFKEGLKTKLTLYVTLYLKHFIVFIAIAFITIALDNYLLHFANSSWGLLIVHVIVVCGSYMFITTLLLYALESGMRGFICRMKNFVRL